MAKRRRKLRRAWKLPDQFTRPLPPAVFRDAFARANAALLAPHPVLHERERPQGVLPEAPEGPLAIRLPDAPFHRVNLTLRECFPDRRDYMRAAWRFWALQDLLDDPRLDPWILVKGPEHWELHEALIAVAATAPLNAQGEFLVEPFCAGLARWAEAHPEQHAEELRKRRRP